MELQSLLVSQPGPANGGPGLAHPVLRGQALLPALPLPAGRRPQPQWTRKVCSAPDSGGAEVCRSVLDLTFLPRTARCILEAVLPMDRALLCSSRDLGCTPRPATNLLIFELIFMGVCAAQEY